jgi:hypothetical protein
LLLAACAPDNRNDVDAAQPDPLQLRISITATYTRTLGENVGLAFLNREPFPVCFSSSDLLPGFGTTFIRNSAGQILNGSANTALEEFRGVNLAGPLVVLRPGKAHEELMDLAEYHPNRTPLVLQVGLQAFRCSDLVDGSDTQVRRLPIQKVFMFAQGRIAERPALRFEMGEEPPVAP